MIPCACYVRNRSCGLLSVPIRLIKNVLGNICILLRNKKYILENDEMSGQVTEFDKYPVGYTRLHVTILECLDKMSGTPRQRKLSVYRSYHALQPLKHAYALQ